MGCWNGTCGLTGLPIFYDDPVIAMLIQREHAKMTPTPCYPWTLWSPATLLVRSTYNDYGGIELDDSIKQRLLATQKDAARIMDKINFPDRDDYGYAYVAVDPFIVEETDDQEHDLYRQPNKDFALWLAHEQVFDDLTTTVRGDCYETRYTCLALGTMTIEKLVAAKVALYREADIERRTEGGFSDNPWQDRGSDFIGAAVRMICEALHKSNSDAMSGEYEIFLKEWAEMRILYEMMSTLRITLYPTGAAGSQDGDLKSYQARNKAVAKQIATANKRFDD